jgi:hypothetical protein
MAVEYKSTEEIFTEIKTYASEIFALQMQKKAIDIEIKEAKQTWKENGVAVSKVSKVLGQLKARAKMSEADKLEEDIIFEKLEADEDIQDSLAQLNG